MAVKVLNYSPLVESQKQEEITLKQITLFKMLGDKRNGARLFVN